MASFYDRHILPRVIGCACANPAIMRQRAKVVPGARGRVLELGIGGGLNLRYYDPTAVEAVFGVDPSAELRAVAASAPRPEGLKVDVREGVAEDLPFASGGFDTIVCTFTLCSVQSPAAALAEARRVLKPGGRMLFCEHGLAPEPTIARWQGRIEPVWKRLAGGCHLTRPVAGTLEAAGLTIDRLETMYLPKAPKVLGWSEWGEAHAA